MVYRAVTFSNIKEMILTKNSALREKTQILKPSHALKVSSSK